MKESTKESKLESKDHSKDHSKDRSPAQPTELQQLLGKISAASRVLNGAASEATRRIEAVEQSLLDAEPGVSVWGATLLTENSSYKKDDGSPSQPAQRVLTLGFAKVKKDKWGICVREELKVKQGAVHEDVTLLRKEERNLRILAVPYLEQLVRDVLGALERQVIALDSQREADSNGAAVPAAEPQPASAASKQ